jgi:hypothetical protein
MTFVGGDNDHELVFFSKIKELFTVLGVEMLLLPILASSST